MRGLRRPRAHAAVVVLFVTRASAFVQLLAHVPSVPLPAGGDALAPELASTHRGSTAPAPVAVFSHSAHMPLVLHFFAHNSKVAGMSLVADLPAQGLVSCIETVPQSALCGPDGLVSFQWDNFAAGRCNFVGTQHGPHVFEQLFYPAARARGLHEARVRHYFILREPIGQIKSMYAHAQVAGSEGYDFVRHIGFAEYVHLTAIRSRNLSLYAKCAAPRPRTPDQDTDNSMSMCHVHVRTYVRGWLM